MSISRAFKFRHANEIAGAFVILAFVLLVAGIFFAGRSQGWFAQRITLHLVFDTPEGTFGLQEGATVQVRNTAAGRVAMLEPTEDGKIQASLRILEQYRRFITEDATARVKRKFGVAGDAFVEIVPGVGALVSDGDSLEVVKDEELLEMAQRILEDLQESLTPIFTHVETIISNTANILVRIDQGEGLAGALISDGEMRDYTKGILEQAEGVTQDARGLVGQVTGLLDNEVLVIAERTASVQRELERTLLESRRVVEALQRHWLIRRYVESDEQRLPLLPGGAMFDAAESVQAEMEEALLAARRADDAGKLVRATYNLAVYALAVNEMEMVESLLYECLVAARRLEVVPAEVRLLQAEWFRLSGRPDVSTPLAGEALDMALSAGRSGRTVAVQAHLLLASFALDAREVDAARQHLRAVTRTRGARDDTLVEAALLGLEARLAFIEGRLTDAGRRYLQQVDALRSHAAYEPMTLALIRAADLFYNAGDIPVAAETYLRAAASLAAQQQFDRSQRVLQVAATTAAQADDAFLVKRVADLAAQLGY